MITLARCEQEADLVSVSVGLLPTSTRLKESLVNRIASPDVMALQFQALG